MRQRELEVLGENLLDVGAADGLGLLNLDDLEDLQKVVSAAQLSPVRTGILTWMDLKRARCLAAMSW